ncbi:hypothetical protein MLD52_16605 [Puniceicoccaceae bacterium K14]|nr:hypothetical protein [Puniceicoccaceae bacterium K14]
MKEPQNNLTRQTSRVFKASVSLATIASTGLFAQDETTEPKEVYELSPFTIQADQSEGYFVSDTLAANRLNSNSEDVAAALTLVSKTFMDDLGVSNIQDLAKFLPSTEPESTQTAAQGENDVFFATAIRIRGLPTQSVARNFFSAPKGEYMPQADGYNMDRATLSAGANAILFGIANPAGVVNTQLSPANTNRNTNQIRNRIDDNGSNRLELAFNRVLVEDKLGVRFNYLNDKHEYFRDPQYFDQRRFYGAVAWKPFQNTTINANLEFGESIRNTAGPNVITNMVTNWLDAGKPTIVVDGILNPGDTPEGELDQVNRITGVDNTRIMFGSLDPDPNNRVQSWKNYAVSGWNPIGIERKHSQPTPFDLYDHTINLGNQRTDSRDFMIGDISIEQKINENFYVQLAYFQNEHNKDVRWASGYSLYGDASETLNDGVTPNLNAGSLLTFANSVWYTPTAYTNENVRLTASYKLDLRDKGKLLGRHMFSAMFSEESGTLAVDIGRLYNVTPLEGYNANILHSENLIAPVFYQDLESGDRTPAEDLKLENWPTQLSKLPGIKAEYLNFVPGYDTETEQTAILFAGQSHLFNEKLIATYGIRRDTQDAYEVDRANWVQNSDGSWASFKESLTPLTLNEAVSGISEETYSYGVVYKLIQSDGILNNFSLTYNRANNFEPATVAKNFQGFTSPNSQGQTIDYGFKFAMFEDKLQAKISWFEGGQRNARLGGGTPGSISKKFDAIWEELGMSEKILTSVTDTVDLDVEGIEFSASYNPTKRWRISLMGSRNEAVRSNSLPSGSKYYTENEAALREFSDLQVAASNNITVGELLDEMKRDIANLKRQDGTPQTELREWKFSLVSNYDFAWDGALKGVAIGGYLNWQDKPVIGHALDETNLIDLDKPYYGSDKLDTGLHIRYSRKLMNDKVNWSIQLNIRNVLDDQEYTASRAIERAEADDLPVYYNYRIPQPRSYMLTNTISW